MASADKVTLRISGDKGAIDIVLTDGEKKGLFWLIEQFKNIPKKEISPVKNETLPKKK